MGSARDGAGHDEAGLEAVRFRWEAAYEIGYGDDRDYWASRRDSIGGLITAADPEALGAQVAEDFAFRAVPRQRAALSGGGS